MRGYGPGSPASTHPGAADGATRSNTNIPVLRLPSIPAWGFVLMTSRPPSIARFRTCAVPTQTAFQATATWWIACWPSTVNVPPYATIVSYSSARSASAW
jgi:hypothetical protein